VRESLSSPGSHRPAVRAHTPAPVREQVGLTSTDVSDEPARPGLVAAQAFVFPHGPPHERVVEVAEDRIQHGLVEASVVVDRAPRGARRKEMTDIKHLIRAGWNAGPGPMQRLGGAGDDRGAGSRAGGQASRQRGGRAALPDARVRASKTERQSVSEAVVEAS